MRVESSSVAFSGARALGYVHGVRLIQPRWCTYRTLYPVVVTDWPDDEGVEAELGRVLRLITEGGPRPALKEEFAEGVVLAVLRVLPHKYNMEQEVVNYLVRGWSRNEAEQGLNLALTSLAPAALISVDTYAEGRRLWRRGRPEDD